MSDRVTTEQEAMLRAVRRNGSGVMLRAVHPQHATILRALIRRGLVVRDGDGARITPAGRAWLLLRSPRRAV